MTHALPADSRFEATLTSLEQISSELVEAREKIVQQQQEIEQLRALAETAVRAQAAAMFQVKQAIVIIKDSHAHAAQVEAALDAERSERLRLSSEMVSINEQVSLLLGTFPTERSRALRFCTIIMRSSDLW